MALSAAEQKKLLNKATPGLSKVGLGDIIEDLQTRTHDSTEATTEAAGLMSAADKTKLDGVAASANNYELPNAGASTRGGVLKGAAVADATDAPTALAQLNALLASLRASGAIAT